MFLAAHLQKLLRLRLVLTAADSFSRMWLFFTLADTVETQFHEKTS